MDNEFRELYQEIILDHNRSPRNFKKLENATHTLDGRNPLCGDHYIIYLKTNNDVIEDVSFEGSGCAISKASASVMSTMIKGKTVDEALRITEKQVAKELGGLPPIKMHCSNLAADALREAILDYKKRSE